MNANSGHLDLDLLLDYWLAEGSPAAMDAVEQHLMSCDACGEQLDDIIALADGVRAAMRAGEVGFGVHGAFVEHAIRHGLQVREYRVPHNGSVNCTVSPDDDLLVSRLAAPLQGVRRVDIVAELSTAPGVQHRMEDVPFDAQAGEVLYLPRLSQVRALPEHTTRMVLVSMEEGGARELGHYTFRHRPWAA